jgi:hypothetical protein
MTNVFVHPRYDERILRLAVGVEPIDAIGGGRLPGRVRVLVEDAPAPLHQWRVWRPGETLDGFLSGLDRHPSGRFGRVYGRRFAGGTVVVRIVDSTGRAGPQRRIVPRRLSLDLADEVTVITADVIGPPHPLFRRVFPVSLFPGGAAALTRRATVVRGRVNRVVDPATGETEPVRWARVRADDVNGDVVGWGHGDDRGEFLLLVGHPETAVVLADDPLHVELTVGATLPPATSDPLDPLRPDVDPLWDLPLEPLPATPTPETDDRYAGRVMLPTQSAFGPFPFDLPLGRESSVQIQIP